MPRDPCWACKVGEFDDCECPPGCDCPICAQFDAVARAASKRTMKEIR